MQPPNHLHLITNLQESHGDLVEIKTTNFAKFLLWKEEEEVRTLANLVQQCAPQMYGTKQHWYIPILQTLKKLLPIRKRCEACESIKCIHSGEMIIWYCSTHHNHRVSYYGPFANTRKYTFKNCKKYLLTLLILGKASLLCGLFPTGKMPLC